MKFEIIKSGARATAPKETLLIQAWGTNAIRVRASKRKDPQKGVESDLCCA